MTAVATKPEFTIKAKTNQELFNKVWHRFITQRHCAGFVDGNCVTYDPARPHARCAMGFLVPEKVLKKWLVRFEVTTLCFTSFITEQLESQGLSKDLAADLQSAHDDAAHPASPKYGRPTPFITGMRRRLTAVAERHGLTVPE